MKKLNLNERKIAECRRCAGKIANDLQAIINQHTTVSIERAILRLFGVDGVNRLNVPYPNIIVDKVKERGLLPYGAAKVMAYMMARSNKNFNNIIKVILHNKVKPFFDKEFPSRKLWKIINRLSLYGISKIKKAREEREKLKKIFPVGKTPWLYVIVATGNIYEDVRQARSACLNGAQCIAVIRSTAQSLMDYVPFGATTQGFGGTYATQENFRIMRKAFDELTPKIGRYVYLVNYCSGLCMSEIAAMGAMERLDMMLNDSMYGIIFRDINIYRTFIDQHFSRMINARARIIINTGEDNYLTTADAIKHAHTVLVSQFINEQLAKNSGLDESLIGLGHVFEIDPNQENGLLYELAQAELVREIFPKAPIKYMPPTKHIDGNIFRTHAIDTMFNLTSIATDQSIHLVGILTEGSHTPFVQDRFLSLESARYVMNTAASLSREIEFKNNGIIQKRAKVVLTSALRLLKKIEKIGLIKAIESGYFANIKRQRHGGKGLEGVIEKAKEYINPFEKLWRS